jgi:6-phosphogluconolactonase (cycloisomerase 2 family)
MVRLEDGYRKPIDTKANPNPFAITPDSAYAFVLLRDDKASVRIAERISLTSFLVDDFPLGSPPNSIAALSGSHNVFVGQVYTDGRISFIDWMSGSVRTVTGFALNGRIQQ